MKSIIIILGLFLSINTKAQSTIVTTTVSVKGNCEECKERIENAADIKGVKKSFWNVDKKVIAVTYDTKKVTLESIEKAIAIAGYETTHQKADAKAYAKLPDCCQYNKGACQKK